MTTNNKFNQIPKFAPPKKDPNPIHSPKECLNLPNPAYLTPLSCRFLLEIDYNENKKESGYDWARLRHFGFYGLILNGPMLYVTYQHILPAIAPGTSGMQLFKKIMFTQTALTLTSVTAFYICLPLI